VCACVGLLFTVLSVYVLSCAASGVIKHDDDSVMTKLRCGGIISDSVIKIFLMILTVKKSLKISQYFTKL